MFHWEWAIVLYSVFHIQQATLEKTYPSQPACQRAMVALGYTQISPLGVHGECQQIAVPERVVPPKVAVPK